MRGRVFSAFFVVRDVSFLIGIACAGLADIIDVRLLVVVSSIVLVGAGLFCTGPARHRPAGGRMAAGDGGPPAARRPRRPVRVAAAGDARRLRPPGRAPARARRGSTPSSARRSSAASRSARCRPGRRSSRSARSATRRTSSSTGGRPPGTPEPDGGYRSLSSMGAGRLLRRDRGADRQPAHRRPSSPRSRRRSSRSRPRPSAP